jgi:hypothetical protein
MYFAGCTAQPDRVWVTQQARQITWEFEERDPPVRYLIRDHGTKFTRSLDIVFEAAGIEILNIPYQAPFVHAAYSTPYKIDFFHTSEHILYQPQPAGWFDSMIRLYPPAIWLP